MTRKQQLFCDYYLISLNATKAAKEAGYSEKTARQIGQENLLKPDIKVYIDERMASKTSKLIAKQDEVLEFLTKMMRGEVDEIKPITVGLGEGVQSLEYAEFRTQPKDRSRAAELIGKRYRLFDKDTVDNKNLNVKIVCDIPKKKGDKNNVKKHD